MSDQKTGLTAQLTSWKPKTQAPQKQVKIRTLEERKAEHASQKARMSSITANSIVGWTSELRLPPGVTLVGACSGSGKSTAGGALVANYIRSGGTRTVIGVLNEEQPADFILRVACNLLQFNFSLHKQQTAIPHETILVNEKIEELLNQIEFIDSKTFDLSDADDVLAIVSQTAVNPEVGLIIVDYLQNVNSCRTLPNAVSWEISKYIGNELVGIGKGAQCPIVVFSQLKPVAPNNSTPFSDRIQSDKTFVNNCSLALELQPNVETSTTKVICHKDRWFGHTGKSFGLRFENFTLYPETFASKFEAKQLSHSADPLRLIANNKDYQNNE